MQRIGGRIDRYGLLTPKPEILLVEDHTLCVLPRPLFKLLWVGVCEAKQDSEERNIREVVFGDGGELGAGELDVDGFGLAGYLLDVAEIAEEVVHLLY